MDTPQIRQLDLAGQLGRGPAGTPAAWPALVGQVVTSAPAVGTYCRVNVVSVLGAETEGGVAATSVSSGATLAVFLVGPHAPFTGDMLVCRFVGHRWVAESGGAGGGTGPTHALCTCSGIPDTLYLHVPSQPTDPMVRSFAHPAALKWQAFPSDIGGLGGSAGYWSDPQETWGLVFGVLTLLYKYRYHLTCSEGIYTLTGWTTSDSPLGYPSMINGSGMAGWSGLPPNTCSPFSLTFGEWAPSDAAWYGDNTCWIDGSGPYG